MLVTVAVLLGLVYGLSGTAREPVDQMSSDLTQYAQGHRDKSVRVCLQLHETASTLIAERPVLSLGGDGLLDRMTSMARQGALTATASPICGQQFRREQATRLTRCTEQLRDAHHRDD